MDSGSPIVLEVGPAVVCRRGAAVVDAEVTDGEAVETALEGIDDPVVLLGERPVRSEDLWRSVIARTLGRHCTDVTLVHPSGWPAPRVARVVRAAASSADRVVPVSRAELRGPGTVVVEIDERVVTVCAAGSVTVLERGDTTVIADTVARDARNGERVIVDVPPGLPGAQDTAAAIRATLAERGLDADDAAVVAGRRRISLRPNMIGAVLLALIVPAVAAGLRPRAQPAEAPAPLVTATVVEGRVAVAVPDGWRVERLTTGPGSPRVRVSPAGHPDDALHITQSYAPGSTLADAGETLGRLAGAEPAFGEFRAHDHVAGRPAVTYRENRPGRTVRWAVLLDGATRISIGCQSLPGAEDGIRTACEQAILSARELPGTPAGS